MTGAPPGVTIPPGAGRSKTISSDGISSTGTHNVTVTAHDGNGNTATEPFSITVGCPDVTVSGLRDVTVEVGASVSLTAAAQGGGEAHTYSLSILPESALDLEIGTSSGSITGTARTPGTYTVSVTASADDVPDNCPAGRRSFTVEVPCPRIAFADIRSFEVEVNQTFTRTAAVSGGCGTRSSSREAGNGWVGHRIDDNGNLIVHGTAPSTPGTHDVRMRVKDTSDAGNYDDESFRITVVNPTPPLGIRCPANRTFTVGDSINLTASAWEGVAPYTFSRPSVRPPGLSLSIDEERSPEPNRRITVTAESVGDNRVTVTVGDNEGASASCGFNVTVRPRPCPTIAYDGPGKVTVQAGGSTTATATASGGQPDYTFTKTDGPDWVTIPDGSTITVTDAPGTPGSHTVNVGIQDANRCAGQGSFVVAVECPDITVTQNPDPVTVSAEGGCGSKTFGNPGGLDWVRKTDSSEYTVAPPAGTAPGDYSFGVTATDAAGNTGPGTINVTVACPDISVSGP